MGTANTIDPFETRLTRFKKEAFELLGAEMTPRLEDGSLAKLDAQAKAKLISESLKTISLSRSLDQMVRHYTNRIASSDRDTTAKFEKRFAVKIRTHAEALVNLLGDPQFPERLQDDLGTWLSGIEQQHEEGVVEPDIFWKSSEPTAIDMLRSALQMAASRAEGYVDMPLPKATTTPQKWLISRSINLATKEMRSKEDGLLLAKKAHWAATGHLPKQDEWGIFHKKRTPKG